MYKSYKVFSYRFFSFVPININSVILFILEVLKEISTLPASMEAA